jgi:hypothetical protein
VGARLVAAAINPHWSQLTHFQHLVLVVMAQTALDTGGNSRPRAVYWAGRDYIALCIFGTDQPAEHQLHAIKRAWAALVKAGAIEPLEHARGQRRARYRLILDQFNQPAIPDE